MERPERNQTKHSLKSPEKPEKKSLLLIFCQLCPKLFFSEKKLKNHFKVHHQGQRLNFRSRSFKYSTSLTNKVKTSHRNIKYTCDTCGSSVSSKRGLKTHVTRVHLGMRPYRCSYCNKGYGGYTALKDHINVQHKIKKDTFDCDKCDKVFISRGRLRSHHIRHGPNKPHRCHPCKMSFYTITQKRIHLETHGPRIKNLKCNLCDKLFVSSESRKNHIKTVHESVVVYTCCVFCDKFIASSTLFDHLRRHIKEYLHQCELCSKSFCKADEKSLHIRSHTGEKPFKCKDCGFCFAIKNSLLRHKRTHLTPKLVPLPCVFCGEEFPTDIQLWRHIARKTDERPYMCHFCPKEFRRKGELNCHIRNSHQRGEYKCDKCDEVFELLPALKSHRHRKHGPKPYQCSICNIAFYQPWKLRDHNNVHHNINKIEFKCNFCNKSYLSRNGLNAHRHRLHKVKL